MQSKFHQLGTYEVNKIPLSYFVDKQNGFDDGIKTLAYRHIIWAYGQY